MAHILVTGATGRIGVPFVTDLLGHGHTVRALAIPDDPRADMIGQLGAEIVTGVIADPAACRAAVAGVDVVYHLAGQLPQDASDDSIFDVNVRGTWNLLGAASAHADVIKLVVFASTDDVYSSVDAVYTPVDENHPRRPVSTYGLSKVIGEDIGSFYQIRHGLPVANARFGLTQRATELLNGITAHFFLLSARIRSLRRQAAEGRADVAVQLAHLEEIFNAEGEHAIVLVDEGDVPWMLQICEVTDLVAGLQLYLDRPAVVGQSFNMGSAAPFTMDVAAAHLNAITGLPVLRIPMPGPRLVINESIAKARSMLGYDPKFGIHEILDRGVGEVGRELIRNPVLG